MAGSFDRPDASSVGITAGEVQRLPVTARIGSHRRLREYRPCWCGDDRECVLISVGVDTDHVIHPLCKHPNRSSDS
jgi:hypothetical protein